MTHTPRASVPSVYDTLGLVDHNLARFNASLELFCRKLGRVLPDISREITNTYHNASLTMDSLISEDPAGLIEITVSALDVSLARIDKHLRDQKAGDALISNDLETFRASLPAAQASVEEFLRRAEDLTTLCATSKGAYSNPLSGQSTQVLARAMAVTMQDMSALHARLSEDMDTAAVLHSGIIRTVERHTALGVKSLKETLDSIIMILKDLIARSTATKAPIQTIMTALQIHDIVRQDIENILTVTQNLRTLENDADHPDRAAFQHQALTVSGELLTDISTIVHEHAQTIARHIQDIHEIIAGVKADKVHLAELLLINADGQSTLDRAMAEIAAIFQDLTERLDQLANVGRLRNVRLNELRALLEGLHQSSRAALQDAEALEDDLPAQDPDRSGLLRSSAAAMLAAVSALEPRPQRFSPAAAHEHDAAEECIALIQEDTAIMRDSLLTIKHLLIDSIEGINDYANRCMLAVLRFKRRMQRLNLFLIRLPDIARTLKTSAGLPAETPQGDEILDAELKSMLATLYHPHIKNLNRPEAPREDAPPDNGDLTLF